MPHRLEIVSNGTGSGTAVLLDGHFIAASSVTFEISDKDFSRVTIEQAGGTLHFKSLVIETDEDGNEIGS